MKVIACTFLFSVLVSSSFERKWSIKHQLNRVFQIANVMAGIAFRDLAENPLGGVAGTVEGVPVAGSAAAGVINTVTNTAGGAGGAAGPLGAVTGAVEGVPVAGSAAAGAINTVTNAAGAGGATGGLGGLAGTVTGALGTVTGTLTSLTGGLGGVTP